MPTTRMPAVVLGFLSCLTPLHPCEATGAPGAAFEANLGQADERVRFVARGRGHGLLLTATEAVLVLTRMRSPRRGEMFSGSDDGGSNGRESAVLRMEFVDGNPTSPMRGSDELPGRANYFTGNHPARWRTNVPRFARVRYEDLYPGIDLTFRGMASGLLYGFAISPGARVDSIRMRFLGAEAIGLASDKSLVLTIGGQSIVQRPPVAYQDANGERHPVTAEYLIEGSDLIRLRVADYDVRTTLFIEPVLEFAGYFGGGDLDAGNAIAVDGSGNVYLGGATASVNLPVADPIQGTFAGFVDAFVAKVSADGSSLEYSTYLGGGASDQVLDIATDPAGNAYVVGITGSSNFPTARAMQDRFGGQFDAFVAKLDPTGSQLVYSTFLGGSRYESAVGLAVDRDGSVLVVGSTGSIDFPTVSPLQTSNAGDPFDGFVSRLSAEGDRLIFSTYLGGNEWDGVGGIGIDSAGDIHMGGVTESSNFPTLNSFQPANGGAVDAFVAGMKADGSALTYASYLGGAGVEDGISVAIDRDGSTYLTGRTLSVDFPTARPVQPNRHGIRDAFVAKVDPRGSTLVYSTYLGGTGNDVFGGDFGTGIAVDRRGRASISGVTNSPDFPTADPTQEVLGGGVCGTVGGMTIPCQDAFVATFNPEGTALVFSTYLGGSARDEGADIAVDARGHVYVTGLTFSTDFPVGGAVQPMPGGGTYDAFLAKFVTPSHSPVAAAGADSTLECESRAGASVSLDGSASADADSSPGTNDDIISFEWIEDLGRPSETFLGEGEILTVTLSLGVHVITLRVTDIDGSTATDDVVVTVADTTAPALAVGLTPAILWPPNHRMVHITVSVLASDLCGSVDVILARISSSEPDDADGNGDGETMGDIQGAEAGTADTVFQLRAERGGGGGGRTYTVTYIATDASDLVSVVNAEVAVLHEQGGNAEPLSIAIDQGDAGTVISWGAVSEARFYNVIRGDLGSLRDEDGVFRLDEAHCIASRLTGVTTVGHEDVFLPQPGRAFYYLVEYNDGLPSSYGTESAAKARFVPAGEGCP